ncbi:MAG: hypothetical protein JW873_01990 [Candidatus Saganbacteria bacterium]|nr:hypothetical protein [Candidatus Saganbacteria bacterium]
MPDPVTQVNVSSILPAGPPAGGDDALKEYLFSLNPARRGAIRRLLQAGYSDCRPATEYPKNCYETMAFVTGQDYLGRRRPATAPGGAVMADQEKIAELLSSAGYVRVKVTFPFRLGRRSPEQPAEIVGINRAALPTGLKPGDLVLFGGRGLDGKGREVDRYIHAVVYLGSYRGRHYIFEKPNYECGAGSPYQIISLEKVFAEMIGLEANSHNIPVDRLFVLRKS